MSHVSMQRSQYKGDRSSCWVTITRLNHAVVSENWQISAMHLPSFLFFWRFFSLLSKPWSVCFRSENWFALQVESALAKVWNGFHRWYIRFVAILTILSMTLFYFNSNKGNSTICKKWAVFNFKRHKVCRHLLSLHKYSRLVFMYTFAPKSC